MKNRIVKFIVCVLCCLFLSNGTGEACINYDDYSSHYVETENDKGIPYPSVAIQDFRTAVARSPEQLYKARYMHSHANNKSGFKEEQRIAIKQLLTGDISQAIKMFLEIEQKYPGQYSTASNLGTAYELNGNNTDALEWINEGIKRNKNSHWGTEWLHVKILETKIKLEQYPEYLKTNWVIPLPKKSIFGLWDSGTANKNLDQIEWALIYQLTERLVFVKPKDPVVANLLFTYSLIVAERSEDIETAVELLKWSNEYGFNNQELWDRTLAHYQNKVLFEYVALIFNTMFLLIMLYLATLFFKLYRNRKKYP